MSLRRAAASVTALITLASCKAAPNDAPATAATGGGSLDRTVLPIAEPLRPTSKELDARNAKMPPRFAVTAPNGAPNVLVILIDDMGFGMSSAFGGPINMPNVERIANAGLHYNHFHTTALCSPTRQALLTGRNHHMGNMGSITETATGYPGQTGQRPNAIAPLAEMLRLNGYSTAAFGKSHETAAWEVSVSGPTDRWPTRSGFDHFYGFIGGEANQWSPALYEDMTRIKTPSYKGYHLMTDLADRAVAWISAEKSLTPDKPFFVYFAPGATHAPHHVPKEWIAKYKGKFDEGWDVLREKTLARQIELGVVPKGTVLAPKPEAIKDWKDLTADEKRLFARQMEVYAGFGEYADYEVGRVLDAIAALGQADNTLVFYIVGDNGTSAEGGMVGVFNEATYFNGIQETVQDQLRHIDDLGSERAYSHMAAGWAVAGDTPFEWTKQVPSYGGTRNAMAVSWPARITDKGLRTQWHHVIDIAPTVLEAAGLPEPKSVNGTVQIPLEGSSMGYTFKDAAAPSRHTTQYFEIFGNRAIYHEGWLATTVHKAPWEPKPRRPLAEDEWELYDTNKDFSLAHDVAKENPEKLKQLQALFMVEAEKNYALPLDDRVLERLIPKLVNRPTILGDRTALTLYSGMTGISENVFLSLKSTSFRITAQVETPKEGARGVLIAQAGRFGGWSFYLKDSKPVFAYNYLGQELFKVGSSTPLPIGASTVVADFAYDGGGPGKGGTLTLTVNGTQVASGRIEHTQCCIFSADEGVDVGEDGETAVSDDYPQHDNAFTGTLKQVKVEIVTAPTGSTPQ